MGRRQPLLLLRRLLALPLSLLNLLFVLVQLKRSELGARDAIVAERVEIGDYMWLCSFVRRGHCDREARLPSIECRSN